MTDNTDKTLTPIMGELSVHDVSRVQVQRVDYADGNQSLHIKLFGYPNSPGGYTPHVRIYVYAHSRDRKTGPQLEIVQHDCNVINLMDALKATTEQE